METVKGPSHLYIQIEKCRQPQAIQHTEKQCQAIFFCCSSARQYLTLVAVPIIVVAASNISAVAPTISLL